MNDGITAGKTPTLALNKSLLQHADVGISHQAML